MEITTWIWSSVWAVELAWVVRLWHLGLVRSYPCLTTYLAVSALHSIASFIAVSTWGQYSVAYAWLWTISRPVLWTLLFCVLIEAYKRMFSQYDGLRRLGELGEYAAFAAVAVVVVAMILIDPVSDSTLEPVRMFWLRQERSAYIGLTLVCLLLASVRVYWQLAVPRNVLILFTVFGLMFATHAALFILQDHFWTSFKDIKHVLAPSLYMGCLLLGILTFSEAGEAHPKEAERESGSDAATVELITGRLESFNQLLLKVLRS